MPGLPWVRLDANIYAHDKIIEMVNQTGGHRAAMVYMFSLAWAGGQGTDGFIPAAVLNGFLHGNRATAELLVKHRLWIPHGHEGWMIYNFGERQQLNATSEALRELKREAGRLGGLETQRRRRGQLYE